MAGRAARLPAPFTLRKGEARPLPFETMMTDPQRFFPGRLSGGSGPLINLDCGTRTPAGVARVADILTEKYEAIGWQVSRHQFSRVRSLPRGNQCPGAAHYDVMLVGHMDTVFPEGTAAKRPLKVEGNQAFGPGVSDMKSGLLSTWYALKGMDPALLAKLRVLVCCNCDEEIGSPWSRNWLVAKAKQSGCVLVAEAARPSGDPISARKGNAKYRIRFHGKASHAGSALAEGVSAITELAHWVLAINEQVNMETGTTMNVGVVQGAPASTLCRTSPRP